MDGLLCFNNDLQILNHRISKMSYIRKNINSSQMIVWSRSDHPPSIFQEIDLRRCDEIIGQGSENFRVLDDFLHTSVLT